MWTTIVGGLFALVGAALGALLEPIKGLLSGRARTRQLRGERAAQVIRCAMTIRQDITSLNSDYRARTAQDTGMTRQELNDTIRSLNQAKSGLREAAGLLRLHGPDDLADAAEQVVDADKALFDLLQEPDEGPHVLAVLPPKLAAADGRLDDVVKEFASLGRRSTR